MCQTSLDQWEASIGMCIGHMGLSTNEKREPAARQISASWLSGCTAAAQNWQHCRVENNCVQSRAGVLQGSKEVEEIVG